MIYLTRVQLSEGRTVGSDHLTAYAKRYGIVPFDRFGAAPAVLDMVRHSFAAYTPSRSADSYATLCLDRAAELLALGRRIRLYWSGGIDSTAAAIALMMAGARREQMEIACSWESVVENPYMFRHLAKRYPTIETPIIGASVANDDVLTVDGELNDQLFGSDVLASVVEAYGVEHLRSPISEAEWQRISKDIFGIDAEMAARMWADILASANSQSVPLETVHDAFWWFNFGFKWQEVSLRGLLRCPAYLMDEVTEEKALSNFVHFFQSDPFQAWAIARNEPKIGDTWQSYKLPAKRFIHDYDKNDDYFENMVKVGSLFNLFARHAQRGPSTIFAPFQLSPREIPLGTSEHSRADMIIPRPLN